MTAVEAGDLKRLAGWASHAIPGRPPHPILAGVVLETDDHGYLTGLGFDHDMQCIGRIPTSDGEQLERTIVHGGLLGQAIGKLTGPVELSRDETHLTVRDKRNRYRLITMPVRDYPIVPATPPKLGTAAHLDTDLARAAFAAAATTNDPKVPVHLVWLAARDGELVVAATDRYRVARLTTDWDGDDFTAPIGAHQAMAALKGLGQGPVDVLLSGNRVGFDMNGWTVTFASLDVSDRTLTSIEGLIGRIDPSGANGTLVVGREQMLDALASAAPVLDNEYQPIAFAITDNDVTLTAGGDSGWERTLESDLLVPGGDAEVRSSIQFAPKMLGSILNNLPTSHAHIVLSAPEASRAPCMVFGGDANDRTAASAYVVMPFTGKRQES